MIAENKLQNPFEIVDAREAQHSASELQKGVEDAIKNAAKELAEKERQYRQALAEKILELRAQDEKPAWTVCDDLARGDRNVARLRYERDVAEGVLDAQRQQAFRRGADRRALDALVRWSMGRDLRVDAAPADFFPDADQQQQRRAAA